MMVTIDMTVSMSWLESRLNFKNLKELQELNYADVRTLVSFIYLLYIEIKKWSLFDLNSCVTGGTKI